MLVRVWAVLLITIGAGLGLVAAAVMQRSDKPASPPEAIPYWAFAVNPPDSKTNPEPDHTKPLHVPGSTAAFTVAQTRDLFAPPDWHPEGHPRMPKIVAHGRKPDIFACGYCHLPNGQGRPENSSLAGLPAAYIVQQMADFKSGLRKSSEPRSLPVANMISHETKANEQETQEAASYFANLKPQAWIRVVETSQVPNTHVAGWMLVASEPAQTEPIGQRIIEMPEDLERTELRDDASGFVAYVPPGSIKRGEDLVKAGGAGKTLPCAACHGIDLRGSGNVPSIAGRSPSYVVRQLYDMQSGARAGLLATKQMKPVVAKLSVADMIDLAAYAASLQP